MSQGIIDVNQRSFLDPGTNRVVHLLVVLVEGVMKDYAAYMGVWSGGSSGVTKEQAEEHIRCYGDKISFNEACCHFPGSLEKGKYRL